MRESDAASRELVREQAWDKLRPVFVGEPGVLAAMRAGVACSHGEVVAFTDDDAEPRREWLGRLLALLLQPGVGAVGGRDVIAGQTEPRRHEVGSLTRYGKLVGNHHLRRGPTAGGRRPEGREHGVPLGMPCASTTGRAPRRRCRGSFRGALHAVGQAQWLAGSLRPGCRGRPCRCGARRAGSPRASSAGCRQGRSSQLPGGDHRAATVPAPTTGALRVRARQSGCAGYRPRSVGGLQRRA